VRRLLLLAVALVGLVYWRRRRASEYVDVTFDDGSSVRLERGLEANDLLDDARELLRALAA
jgi:hypothetical protein